MNDSRFADRSGPAPLKAAPRDAVTVPEQDFHPLEARAEAAGFFLKSLANPVRLRILCALHGGEAAVGALAQTLGVRETLISQHLAILRRDGIVAPRRAGQAMFYRIVHPAAARIVTVLYESFCATPEASGASPNPES